MSSIITAETQPDDIPREDFVLIDAEIEKSRILSLIEKHYTTIEEVRREFADKEIWGIIYDDHVEWPEDLKLENIKDIIGWEQNRVNAKFSIEEKRVISAEGGIFFHSHPDKKDHESYQSSPSTGDISAAIYGNGEIIFHKLGATLLIPTKRLPAKATLLKLTELKDKSNYDDYNEPGWAMHDLMVDTFGMMEYQIPADELTHLVNSK